MELLATIATMNIPATVDSYSIEIEGYIQQVYTVTLDLKSDAVELDQGFSFDMFYGFERTSEIADRHEAEIALNGVFYNQYGMPYGILVDDFKYQGINSNGSPTVIINDQNEVFMKDITIDGYVSSKTNELHLWGVNIAAPTHSIVLYDKTYGRSNRVYRPSVNYVISQGIVSDIIVTDSAVKTDLGDYILTHITSSDTRYFEIGEEVTIDYNISGYDGVIKEAFQTGGWLVKEGLNVAKAEELYVGPTNSLQPRTLVGKTAENHLVFVVIDGRNPEYSYGVTGKQAAELLIKAGCVEGGYLDGGASSTLVVSGEVKNQPSTGEEREIAHSLLIQLD